MASASVRASVRAVVAPLTSILLLSVDVALSTTLSAGMPLGSSMPPLGSIMPLLDVSSGITLPRTSEDGKKPIWLDAPSM